MAIQLKDPSRAVITSVGGALNGGTADSTTPVIKGTADAGDIVDVYDGVRWLGSAVVAANGTWSFTPATPIKAGTHSFAAIAHDSDGNYGDSSVPVNVQINAGIVPPAAPSVDSVTDNVGPITGPVPKNGTTDDNDPTIAGKGVAGDVVHVKDNGTEIGSATVDANGNWSFKPTTPLADGSHDITATQTDPKTGATSPASADWPFKVDTSTPVAPVIVSVNDAVGPITGPVPKNGITDDNDPTIKGTGTAGDIVHVKDNGTEIGTATVDASGNWSLKPATPLANGAHDITATQANPATGKVSPVSADWPFLVVGAPAAPSVDSVTDNAGPITGPVPKNGTTDDNDPTIAGKGVADDVVHVKDNGTEIGSATVDANGNWSFKPTTPLADGSHDITATQTDPITGATSPASADWPFKVDTSTPVAPVIVSVNDAVGPVTGPVPKNGTTDDNDPTIKGTGTAGDIVHVKDNGTEIGTATVDASGNWSFKPATPLADGAHDITATQANPATGKVGPASGDWPFTVASAPAAPSVDSVTDAAGPITGPVPKNGTTDDNDPTIAGKGVAGDVVHVKDNGTEIGSTTVDANGNWSFKPTTPLADGSHDVTATQTDPTTGATSPASADWPFKIDTTAPVAPVIVSVNDAVGPVTGPVPKNGTTDDNDPTIKGTGVAGDVVHVMDNGREIGTATVDASGNWSFKPVTPLADGAHDITATQANPSTGKLSPVSTDWPFTVKTSGGDIMYDNTPNSYIKQMYGATGFVYLRLADYANVDTIKGVEDMGAGNTPLVWTMTPSSTYASFGAKVSVDTFVMMTGTIARPLVLTVTYKDGTSKVVFSGNASYWLSHPMVWEPLPATGLQSVLLQSHQSEAAVPSTEEHVQSLSNAADADSTVAATTPDGTSTSNVTAVAEHDAFKGTTGHDTVDLNADPTSYFKEATAHIEGSTLNHTAAAASVADAAVATDPAVATGPVVNTLHLTGDHQILDLTSLTGKTAAAKISGIEVIDLGGHSNNLKLSLTDVLNLGEQDLFQKDGHQQMMVKGSDGDTVDLSNSHIAGVADGQWQQEGTAQVGGVTYNVYEHSGAHTELLVQQGVQIALHN